MLLDAGVLSTKFTEYEFFDSSDALTPYTEESLDDLQNIDDYLDQINNNDTHINFNGNVSKLAIDYILDEMRMVSPIQNDLANLLGDEPGSDLTIDPSICFNEHVNQIEDSTEQNAEGTTKDNSLLQQLLLYPESCSTPDVQVEFNDGVQFKYEACEQFNLEPDITLPYPEESGSAVAAVQDNNGLNMDEENNNDSMKFELEPYLIQAETISNNQYFECSTNLPMTSKELQDDIQKYLNNEQSYSYASIHEFTDTMNETMDKDVDNTFDFYHSEMLQEYIQEQNQLYQSPVYPIDSAVTPNMAYPEEVRSNNMYKCNTCSFYSESMHGLSVHMRVHSNTHLSCTECKFTTSKPYCLRQHQAYGHGTAYCCQTCDYVTHSSSKIRSHMRREH